MTGKPTQWLPRFFPVRRNVFRTLTWLLIVASISAAAWFLSADFDPGDADALRRRTYGYILIGVVALFVTVNFIVFWIRASHDASAGSDESGASGGRGSEEDARALPDLFYHWHRPFVVIYWLVVVTLATLTVRQFHAGTFEEKRLAFIFLGILFAFVVTVSFVYVFTKDLDDDKDIVTLERFSYAITMVAILISVQPFFFLSSSYTLRRMLADEPIGIMQGCRVADLNLEDDSERESGELATACLKLGPQWMANLGGSILAAKELPRQDIDVQSTNSLQAETNANSSSETRYYYVISGGVVVPLYIISLAIVGAAVSMMRRVPEYQRRTDKKYRGKDYEDKGEDLPAGLKPSMLAVEVREALIFQILQVVSAPFIAVVAYYLLLPESVSTTVMIGFVAGFASELILNKIRDWAETMQK